MTSTQFDQFMEAVREIALGLREIHETIEELKPCEECRGARVVFERQDSGDYVQRPCPACGEPR